MIKMKKLDISNYRSCTKTGFDIHPNLTTLIGRNGAGKSNILNSIQLLKKVNYNKLLHKASLLDPSFLHSQIEMILDINNEEYNLKADMYYDTNEINVDEIYSAELKIKRKDGNSEWIGIDPDLYSFIDFAKIQNQTDITNIINGDLLKSQEEVQHHFDIVSYLANVSYYTATQFSDPAQCPTSLGLEESRFARHNRGIKTYEQFIYDLYRSYKFEEKEFKKYIDIVDKNGIGLIDDITFIEQNISNNSSLKVKSGGKMEKVERGKNIIIPSILTDDLKLSPNQLSEGTFKTLALVFYILNDKSDLLLIEEPEVCVHHGLLDSIIDLIKSRSVYKQIIISTHSGYVLDKLNPENIVLVKKTKEEGTIASPLPEALSANDFKALKEYLKDSGNLGEYWIMGGFENE